MERLQFLGCEPWPGVGCEIARAALAGPTLIDLSKADRTGALALLDCMLHGAAKRVATVGLPLTGSISFQTKSAARRWLA